METKALFDKKAALISNLRSLDQRLKSENRQAMTSDELETFDRIDQELNEVSRSIEAIERMNGITNEEPKAPPAESKPNVTRQSAFLKYLRRGEKALTAEERSLLVRGTNTITTTTSGTTYGGYAVAEEFSNELNKQLKLYGGMMAACRIVNTSTGGTLSWPTMNDTAAKATIVAEAAGTTVQDFTLGRVQLGAYTYRDLIKLSAEWVQDEAVNLTSEMPMILGDRFGRGLNEHLTTGDGSGKPSGFVTDASTGKTGAAAAITHTDFIDLEHSVDPAYRTRGAFMMNDSTLAAVKKLSIGSSDDRPLWMPSLVQGTPDTILGYSYVINQDMANIGASAKPIAFGDWSRYIIRQVGTMNLRVLNERYADELVTGYLAWARYDGKLLDAAAIKVFANAAS